MESQLPWKTIGHESNIILPLSGTHVALASINPRHCSTSLPLRVSLLLTNSAPREFPSRTHSSRILCSTHLSPRYPSSLRNSPSRLIEFPFPPSELNLPADSVNWRFIHSHFCGIPFFRTTQSPVGSNCGISLLALRDSPLALVGERPSSPLVETLHVPQNPRPRCLHPPLRLQRPGRIQSRRAEFKPNCDLS